MAYDGENLRLSAACYVPAKAWTEADTAALIETRKNRIDPRDVLDEMCDAPILDLLKTCMQTRNKLAIGGMFMAVFDAYTRRIVEREVYGDVSPRTPTTVQAAAFAAMESAL